MATGAFGSRYVAYAVLGAALLAEMIAIAIQTGQPVFFALDDPYIHLALAEGIVHGQYGINPGEYASPSSSILYPLLLAPFAALGIGEWGALALNIAASFGILIVWRELFLRFGFSGDRGTTNVGVLLATLSVNGVSLVFTGMEHTLQVFCTLAVALAIIDVAEDRATPWFLVPAAFAGALLRYEGGAVAGAAILVLAWSGRWRQVALLAGLVVVAYGGFSLFLHRLGLPLLPSSVLAKSNSASAMMTNHGGIVSFIKAILRNMKHNLTRVHEIILGGALLSIGLTYYRGKTEGEWLGRLKVCAFMLCVLTVHLVAFRSGWFYRYEPYAVAVLLSCLGYVLFSGRPIPRALPLNYGMWTLVAALAWLLAFARIYADAAVKTPEAAELIYLQQFQMHRFAAEFWKAPVAVNDLGLVAFRNPYYVLDLRGLGLDAARRAYERRDTAWIARAVVDKHVGVAMVYNAWFAGFLPQNWVELARLRRPQTEDTLASSSVSIYLLDPSDRDRAMKELKAFATTLPKGAALEMAQ